MTAPEAIGACQGKRGGLGTRWLRFLETPRSSLLRTTLRAQGTRESRPVGAHSLAHPTEAPTVPVPLSRLPVMALLAQRFGGAPGRGAAELRSFLLGLPLLRGRKQDGDPTQAPVRVWDVCFSPQGNGWVLNALVTLPTIKAPARPRDIKAEQSSCFYASEPLCLLFPLLPTPFLLPSSTLGTPFWEVFLVLPALLCQTPVRTPA